MSDSTGQPQRLRQLPPVSSVASRTPPDSARLLRGSPADRGARDRCRAGRRSQGPSRSRSRAEAAALLLQQLPANLSRRVRGGVHVQIPDALREIGGLVVRERRLALDRAGEWRGERDDRTRILTGLGRSVEVRGSRGARQPRVSDYPRQLHGPGVVLRVDAAGALAVVRRNFVLAVERGLVGHGLGERRRGSDEEPQEREQTERGANQRCAHGGISLWICGGGVMIRPRTAVRRKSGEGLMKSNSDAARAPGPLEGVRVLDLTSMISRSVAIDLKSAAGLGVLRRLIPSCDVFVQNFRPGAIERMGLGEAAVRELREDIVYVSISGFGETGLDAHKRVYDPVIQALSGL